MEHFNLALKETLTHAHSNNQALSIWFIHDTKPGHLHQLEGLEERIAYYCKTTPHWVNVQSRKSLWSLFSLKDQTKTLPPDIIIGAGHKTHIAVLAYAYFYKAYSIVLMRPSFPLRLFDAVICPEHDKIKTSKRVLNTYGVLNKIQPSNNSPKKTSSLMLIGGPSKHYEWEEEILLSQINYICKHNKSTQWLLSNSPRTPSSFFPKLKEMNIQNLNYFHFQDKNFKPLHKLMLESNITWVTPDSVSMLYESLTSQAPTFIFSLPNKNTAKPSRVANTLLNLVTRKDVVSFENWQLHRDMKPNKLQLWEADRAAKWLLSNYFETLSLKTDI